MSIIDDKKNIFNQIKTYSTIGQTVNIPKNKNDLLDSINTKKNDITGFLIETLKTVAGSAALKELTGEILSTFLDDAEQTIKKSVKSQLTKFNTNIQLPTDFINNGIEIKAPHIDLSDKLKVDPNSDIGDLLYDKTNVNFDKISYDAIVADGSEKIYNNLKIKYDSVTNSFNYKPNISSPNINIGEWVGDYVDNTEFINKKEFTSNILNDLYGTISKKQNKNIESIIKELELNKLIDKIIEGDYDDYIELSDNEIKLLHDKAKEIKNGVVSFDMGCGMIYAELSVSGLTDLISSISGSTNPFIIADNIDKTLNKTFENTKNDVNIKDNKTSINDNFFSNLIQYFKTEFSKIVAVSPQARMLLSITSSFENNGVPQIGDVKNDLNMFKNTIKCMIDDIIKALFAFIFTIVIGFLMSLLQPIIKTIPKDKIVACTNILMSLISSKIDAVKNIV